jgi:hypothetical protein
MSVFTLFEVSSFEKGIIGNWLLGESAEKRRQQH